MIDADDLFAGTARMVIGSIQSAQHPKRLAY